MANFIVATGMSPTEYKGLTLLERDEIAKALQRANRQQ